MFQLDRGDLDFGLYRIMKLKSDEIERFLTEELLPQVSEALGLAQAVAVEEAKQRYDEALEIAKEAANQFDIKEPEQARPVKEAKKALDAAKNNTVDPTNIYADLHRFFARYYDSGDFMSLKRYMTGGKEAFLIPYNGEEVKLHWANADQYYIKTSKNYQSYLFNPGTDDRQVRFQIAAADTEKDNIKETDDNKRRFILAKDNPVCEEGGTLVVNFEHRPLTDKEKNDNGKIEKTQQKNLNEAARKRILAAAKKIGANWEIALAAPTPTDANPDRTVLQKHIEKYVAGNEFDYFIHKDLGGFLTRELDFFLKNEVLVLDNVQDDADALRRALVRMKAIRSIGGKIIAFLAQLEEFQKRLWLKKKFVLQTEYCITLDRVPEGFYAEIAANRAQVAEWKKLFAIEDMKGGKRPSAKFLKDNPFLVLDTAHFDSDFKDRLLGALSDLALGNSECLEDTMDGLLIHGENFQTLNLLQARYKQKVQCIYIDPPYNTDASKIIYKNGYAHSSWLCLLENRVRLGVNMADPACAVMCSTIDDTEHKSLSALLEQIFGENVGTVAIRIKPSGRPIPKGFAVSHEYAIFNRVNDKTAIARLQHSDEQTARYRETDEKGPFFFEMFRKAGSGSRRSDRRTMFYPFYHNQNNGTLRLPQMEWQEETQEYLVSEEAKEQETIILPIKDDGSEGRWYFGLDRALAVIDEFKIENNGNGAPKVYYRRRPNEGAQPTTHWADAKYSATEHGTNLVKDIFGQQEVFSFPKSIYAVEDCLRVSGANAPDASILDYFAGSGTTGHAVINLNREDTGNRKYILVEVGHHFDTVLLPRLKKITYSHDWKGGKPVSREGSAQFFKYLRIESYEDALDGLVHQETDVDLLAGLQDRELKEDYLLRYQLTHETQASATLMGGDFDKPEGYTLSVVRGGTRRDETADLAETFNYLLGLKLAGRWRIDGVLAVKGIDPKNTAHLILWRDTETMPNDELNKWFGANRDRFGDNISNIYVNGDQTLNTVEKKKGESWRAESIEPAFRDLMFEGR